MSEFSTNMGLAWDTSISVFGDTCILNGGTYNCIIHGFTSSDGVERGKPGRTVSANGVVIMSVTDWVTAAGAKGQQITLNGTVFRITNNPDVGATSDHVELQIGPLT